MKTATTILLFLLASNMFAQKTTAQTKSPARFDDDVALLQQAFSSTPKLRLTAQFSLSRENPNELQMALSGLFLFYKAFFSSQDNQRCSFHPSCSEFGLEAVKKFGVARGIVCTFDRLTRCNGLSPQQYEVDKERKLLKDPVRW